MLRTLLAGAALALLAGTAQAQLLPKETATVCVDVNGALKAPDCHSPEASRLKPNYDVCTCSQGVRAEASVCPGGATPPGESAAVQDFRRQYLRNRQTLVGANYQGHWLCVPPRTANF
jgi:hypothetical protein